MLLIGCCYFILSLSGICLTYSNITISAKLFKNIPFSSKSGQSIELKNLTFNMKKHVITQSNIPLTIKKNRSRRESESNQTVESHTCENNPCACNNSCECKILIFDCQTFSFAFLIILCLFPIIFCVGIPWFIIRCWNRCKKCSLLPENNSSNSRRNSENITTTSSRNESSTNSQNFQPNISMVRSSNRESQRIIPPSYSETLIPLIIEDRIVVCKS